MTEPTVLRGRDISTVWLGLSGAWTWRGAAGARPKLGREKPPREWQGEQVLTWDGGSSGSRAGRKPLQQAGCTSALGPGQTDKFLTPTLNGCVDGRNEPWAS